MKRKIKSVLLFGMAIVMVFLQSRSVSAAVDSSYPGTMLQPNKEEVVYALLTAQGALKDLYLVNIFTLDQPGIIQDYGRYTDLRNMTTEDAILQDEDSILIKTDAEKLYYQGTLLDAKLPWDISIRYALDGVEYPAAELAGKSGALILTLSITKNANVAESFYDGCALQVSVTLDTMRCSNIVAEGATVANAGKNKQINYTALPGKGLQATIQADVREFEMERISINGLGLALDFDVNTEEFSESFVELQDAVDQLNSGAGELADAIHELYDGAGKLLRGMDDMRNGVVEFDDGMGELQAGMQEFRDGAMKLADGASEFQDGLRDLRINGYKLVEGSAEIQKGIAALHNGLSGSQSGVGNIGGLAPGFAQLKGGLGVLKTLAAGLNGAISALHIGDVILQNEAAITALSQLGDPEAIAAITALRQSNGVLQGLLQIQNDLIGSPQGLIAATEGLYIAADALDAGISTLAAALGSLPDLIDGIAELNKQYKQFHDGLKQYADGVVQLEEGYVEMYMGIVKMAIGSDDLLRGIVKLKDGSYELSDGIDEYYDGLKAFRKGIGELYKGALEYSDGTQEFYDETRGLDSEIGDRIDEIMKGITGKDVPLRSFASEKNTNIRSVQFVMATEAIKLEEQANISQEEPPTSTFWGKLLDLFK